MQNSDINYDAHVFVCTRCTYQLEDGESSSPEIAPNFRKRLKEMAKTIWPKDRVRINASGCLGQCEKGISCAIYPQNKWILELREGQEDRVISSLHKIIKKP